MSKLVNQKTHGSVSFVPLNNRALSWKAKGILAYLESRPDGWDFSINGVKAASRDGRLSLDSGIQELKDAGYLEIRRDGIEWEWVLLPDLHPGNRGDDTPVSERSVLPTSEDRALLRVSEVKSNRTREKNMFDSGESNAFEELWALHRRGSKKDARRRFHKALKSVDLETLRTAYHRYRSWVAAQGQRDFDGAHFATWLNQERWDEDVRDKKRDAYAGRRVL